LQQRFATGEDNERAMVAFDACLPCFRDGFCEFFGCLEASAAGSIGSSELGVAQLA
jgi:hypothetical protein